MTTPIRETIARVYVETVIGKPDPDWADHWQWYLDFAGNPDSCVHYSNHGRGAQHADAVLRAIDEAGLVVVPKQTGGLGDIRFFVRSALNGFETLQPDDAIENATWDLREVLSIMSAMIAAAPSTAPDVVG